MFKIRIEKIIKARTPRKYRESLNFFKRRNIISQPTISPKRWIEFYSNMFPPRLNSSMEIFHRDVPFLDRRIRLIELDTGLKALKERKAAGFDGIPAKFYKSLTKKWR